MLIYRGIYHRRHVPANPHDLPAWSALGSALLPLEDLSSLWYRVARPLPWAMGERGRLWKNCRAPMQQTFIIRV